MKLVLAIVSILVLGMAPGAMSENYGWSLSGSSTDPNVNTAPITTRRLRWSPRSYPTSRACRILRGRRRE